MIILRQKEFGNKANKAAKRKYEIELGKSLPGKNNSEKYLLQQARKHQRLNPYDTADNGNRSLDAYINQKNAFRTRGRNTSGSKETNDRYTDTIMALHIAKHQQHKKNASTDMIEKTDRVFNRALEKGFKLNKKGQREEDIEEIKNIVKDNKVALGIAGGAALIGGGAYLIHRHNKKKKEAENKKNQAK